MALQTAEQEGVIALTAIISIFVAFPIVIAIARVIWKKTSEPARPRAIETDQVMRRLEQLQQTVEAMAIEVERISEGQRFVTKLMSDRDREALGAGRKSDN